ncbi:hypothetical protein PHYPSEUDO_003987 [Phytophthora pseudosyringae]|uniref:Uncharacterized protein n=1 Tax=Phytophthora pseudosyringae TaxID=221518 RepID=A0A8T1VP31_9STRA|nr:hypothetical protein PHYPSEUDO_003987 [Phytophthora pseudosyringae]
MHAAARPPALHVRTNGSRAPILRAGAAAAVQLHPPRGRRADGIGRALQSRPGNQLLRAEARRAAIREEPGSLVTSSRPGSSGASCCQQLRVAAVVGNHFAAALLQSAGPPNRDDPMREVRIRHEARGRQPASKSHRSTNEMRSRPCTVLTVRSRGLRVIRGILKCKAEPPRALDEGYARRARRGARRLCCV